jgi:hypothetical protein
MLEALAHQAAGLAALAPQAAQRLPRLGALVAHGDGASELPLLWQLCASWTALDYPVAVLDATVRESETAPGLLQLLQGSLSVADLQRGLFDWPVLPAARGLAWLAADARHSAAQRARALAAPVAGIELLMLYAPAALLAQALGGSALAPLLSVSARPQAQLSAYLALKQLLNAGGLRPTIVNVMNNAAGAPPRAGSPSPAHRLQQCARDFLATDVNALTVNLNDDESVQALALRCLDEALAPEADTGRLGVPFAAAGRA